MTSLKIGRVGSKTRSLGQMLVKPCAHSRGLIFSLMIMKLGQNFCLAKISESLKMGHFDSKTRSLGQILENLVYTPENQIFGLILMKLGQSVCPNEILYMLENWSCRVKK